MKGKQEAAPLFPSNRHRRRHAHRWIKQKETSDRLLRKSKPPHPPLPAPSVSDGPPKAKQKRVIPSRRSSRVRKRRCPGRGSHGAKKGAAHALEGILQGKGSKGEVFSGYPYVRPGEQSAALGSQWEGLWDGGCCSQR